MFRTRSTGAVSRARAHGKRQDRRTRATDTDAVRPQLPALAAGVDIGGTKISVALVDAAGRLLARESFPTEAESGFERTSRRIGDALEALLKSNGRPELAGIGVGCAGPVDPLLGLINNPYTLGGWNRCDIVTPLRQRFGVPTFLENDADVAAVGEAWIGAGRDTNPLVMLTFGTGVGGGAILDQRILRGVRGEHPEIGHVPIDPQGPPCYCGIRGCLESTASGTALGQAAKGLGMADARELFAAANAGHAEAVRIVDRAVEAVATAAWILCHTLLPQRLVLGGGIMETEFDRFAGPIRARLAAATQFTPSHVSIVQAQLGNDAGLIGAARWSRQMARDL